MNVIIIIITNANSSAMQPFFDFWFITNANWCQVMMIEGFDNRMHVMMDGWMDDVAGDDDQLRIRSVSSEPLLHMYHLDLQSSRYTKQPHDPCMWLQFWFSDIWMSLRWNFLEFLFQTFKHIESYQFENFKVWNKNYKKFQRSDIQMSLNQNWSHMHGSWGCFVYLLDCNSRWYICSQSLRRCRSNSKLVIITSYIIHSSIHHHMHPMTKPFNHHHFASVCIGDEWKIKKGFFECLWLQYFIYLSMVINCKLIFNFKNYYLKSIYLDYANYAVLWNILKNSVAKFLKIYFMPSVPHCGTLGNVLQLMTMQFILFICGMSHWGTGCLFVVGHRLGVRFPVTTPITSQPPQQQSIWSMPTPMRAFSGTLQTWDDWDHLGISGQMAMATMMTTTLIGGWSGDDDDWRAP